MRRIVLVLLNILSAFCFCYAQTGVWSGTIEVQGVKLPLVLHLDEDNPMVDSPAQGVRGIPMKFNMVTSDSIDVTIPMIGATFNGRFQDDKIVGIFSQRGIKLPLILQRGESVARRPQTPVAPFPYSQEDVSFSNGDAVLKGTLTLPEGYSRTTPIVIMITGSGLQNRDEELFEHKPFAVIADALARNGVASLRYDDRGFGESSGDVVNCTTEDLKNDALAGIELLRQRFDHVGVLGHSEGGTIAFILGADNKCDFIISMAGMIVSGAETLMAQNKYALARAGYPQQTADEYCELLSSAFRGDDALASKVSSSALPLELKQNLMAGLGQLATPYMQYFINLDIRDILPDISCPVLALNGTKDAQVFHAENFDALKKGLPSNDLHRFMEPEGLNHLFQHCETGAVTEYGTIEETISPEVLMTIYQWIKQIYE
ncbi:MAG: alpha/beta hydrolase [Muribaculaceae bacterium]|nr:alpha/beta hydrolase [Muribaculaceae bacterium]